MPPAPSEPVTSYGPILVPALRLMKVSRVLGGGIIAVTVLLAV
jgi:hypothetical protein